MIYLRLWLAADGTSEFGQSIRWLLLLGYFGANYDESKRFRMLDRRNFKKWQKINGYKSFQEYLDVARV